MSGVLPEIRRVFQPTGLDSLILFVTNACNLRCWFCCYADNLNQTKDIPFDALLKLSATMPRFRALLLSGGEPFIRPRLDEIMLAFVRNNAIRSIYIPTNGWYLERTEGMCKSFLEQERDAMLTLSFSVDGLAETHDQIRTKGTKGSFAALCKTIEHLSPWREKYPNLRLRVNSVVTPDNIGEMRATIDFFYAHYELDEHALEIVRDLSWLGAHHDAPEKTDIAQQYHELVEYSYGLYYMNGARRHRAQFNYIPETMSNLATYAYSLTTSEIKVERIMGHLWPFPCTAGSKILVVSGSGSLRACEHRGEVVDLRRFDFDYGKAMATGLMEKEIAQIKKDRCDCIHGCFVGNSLQHSPKALATRALPKALHALRHKRPR
ncbi:MAG TPA: radical SAM protein [Gemmatimonadales bacterium]|nr:radical SAM protein [Gemmatimonadales bacterium]